MPAGSERRPDSQAQPHRSEGQYNAGTHSLLAFIWDVCLCMTACVCVCVCLCVCVCVCVCMCVCVCYFRLESSLL